MPVLPLLPRRAAAAAIATEHARYAYGFAVYFSPITYHDVFASATVPRYALP